MVKKNYYIKTTKTENKIPNVAGLVTITVLNTKATEVEIKIPNITNLATKASLNTKMAEVESKIPNSTNLTTKVTFNTEVTEIQNKIPDTTECFTTPLFNKLTKIARIVSERLSDEIIKFSTKPVNSLAPKLKWIHNAKIAVKFKETCLKQDRAIFTHKTVVNLFVFESDTWSKNLHTKFTLGDCVFIAKNAGPDKYR